jgi:hypothetical protein
MRSILREEANNAASLADTAQRMKTMTPSDVQSMITELSNMNAVQRDELKRLGMDPDAMLRSMAMMRDNPAIMASAQRMMEKMTPEEMLLSSKKAQEQMSKMSPEDFDAAAKMMSSVSPTEIDNAVDAIRGNFDKNEVFKDSKGAYDVIASEESSSASTRNGASDPAVIDAFYRSAEFMSRPPTGGVTFRAFKTLAPIAALMGERESDLSLSELKECWETGCLGADRVDRAGFLRVWREVGELFEGDIMDEARDPNSADARAGIEVNGRAAPQSQRSEPVVGATLSDDQLLMVNEQIKNMSDDQMTQMLESMSNMGADEENRLRAMGVDPGMMKASIKMMKDNPMMRKAAQAMVSKLSPEQLRQASEQAQKQLAKKP